MLPEEMIDQLVREFEVGVTAGFKRPVLKAPQRLRRLEQAARGAIGSFHVLVGIQEAEATLYLQELLEGRPLGGLRRTLFLDGLLPSRKVRHTLEVFMRGAETVEGFAADGYAHIVERAVAPWHAMIDKKHRRSRHVLAFRALVVIGQVKKAHDLFDREKDQP